MLMPERPGFLHHTEPSGRSQTQDGSAREQGARPGRAWWQLISCLQLCCLSPHPLSARLPAGTFAQWLCFPVLQLLPWLT